MTNTKSGWRFDLKSMLLVGFMLIAARGAVLLRDIYMAANFGVSGVVDAFNIAFTIISWPAQVVVSVVTIAVVPLLVRLTAQQAEGERSQLIIELNFTLLVIAMLVAAIILIFVEPLCAMFTSSLDPATAALTLKMTRWFVPLAFLMVVAGYLSARLQALRSNMYTLFEGFPAAAIIGVLLLLDGWFTYQGDNLIFGILFGTCLQCLALIWLLKPSREKLGSVSMRHSSPYWRSLYSAIGTMALGQIILSLVLPIDQYFLARLGDGEVARYGYALRVVSLINMLGTTVIARVLLPSFSDFIARNEFATARRYAIKWAIGLLMIGIVGSVIAQYPIAFVVKILFERGQFTSFDTNQTAAMVKILIFQAPFFLSGQVLVQWFAVNQNYKIMLIGAIFSLFMKILFIILFFNYYGINSILFSMVLIYICSSFYMFYKVFRQND